MSFNGQDLFNLLPAYYRQKDTQLALAANLLTAQEAASLKTLLTNQASLDPASQAQLAALQAKAAMGPLQSLLMLIAEQVAAVEEDLNQLYDDEFIETCAPWVIPYIGDLIGYQPVHGVAAAVASPRAEVAHTISFRRRKGTILVIEQLARDVTGWGAHAVEFFELLSTTQYVKHVRPHNHYAPDLRGWKPRAYQDTGFDATAHTAEVRRIETQRGRYNLPNIGVFLWSTNAYPLTNIPCVPASDAPATAGSPNLCFRVSPLDRDLPLFNFPISQGSDLTAAATPANVPAPLTRRVLCQDIQSGAGAVYYGPGKSLFLTINKVPVSPYQIQVCDLAAADGTWTNLPGTGSQYLAAVDPETGRIALPPTPTGLAQPTVLASYCYGFNGDLGGGPYARNSNLADGSLADSFVVQPNADIIVTPYSTGAGDSLLKTLVQAIKNLAGGGSGALEITDNGTYSLAVDTSGSVPIPLALNIPADATFEFRAADGCRPTILLGGELEVSGGSNSSLYLNGLLFTYSPPSGGGAPPPSLLHATGATSNQLENLGITHCTFVPGWALNPDGSPQPAYAGLPVIFAETADLTLQIVRSIVGTIWVNREVTASLTDSILDATTMSGVAYAAATDATGLSPQPGGSLSLSGCTVVGKVYASLLSLVTDSIIWADRSMADQTGSPPPWRAALWASQQQDGCVRFSYVPSDAILPRQYECVTAALGQPQPIFLSLRYGDPGYAKLSPGTDDLIRRGADDGGEMGGFHFVLAPQRETDLLVRLQEYLPVNLESGIFYQT